MEFVPPNLNIAQLKRKMDIRGLTVSVDAETVFNKGRFYMLWRNGLFIVIQAEPWWRSDHHPDHVPLSSCTEELRALSHLQEVLQTMLDTIVIDGENNWAHLVRLKGGSYRMVYKKRQLLTNCQIWTKVVELDDIEMTRFVTGSLWEGIYEGRDIDLFMGWQDDWGIIIAAESRGQKLVQSRGVGHYFFELEAHVSQCGVIVGLMMEPIVGRCVTFADRTAVFEAVADIQRHGISFMFQVGDIYITKQGVRFASVSSAHYFEDGDELVKDAEYMWKTLAEIFNPTQTIRIGIPSGSRSQTAFSFIIPPPPSPARPITLMPEEAVIRWVWSIAMSETVRRLQNRPSAFMKSYSQHRSIEYDDKRIKDNKKILLPPDDSGDLNAFVTRIKPVDELDQPLVISRGPSARGHPYARPQSKRLLLP